MNLFKHFAISLSVVVLSASTSSAQRTVPVQLEFAISDSIPVSIQHPVIYENYSDEKLFHTIEFFLTNKSEMYIDMVQFIQYELDENNEVLSTTFWSHRDGLKPFETRWASTSDNSLGDRNARIVWSVSYICTDKGTWSMELKKLQQAIQAFVSGEKRVLPAAEFDEREFAKMK